MFIVEVYYVPVYRSTNNSVPPILGTPCDLENCHSPPQPHTDSNCLQSPVNPLLVGRAFAGPMSPAKVCVCLCVCLHMHFCIFIGKGLPKKMEVTQQTYGID